jgi:hypothetical protein
MKSKNVPAIIVLVLLCAGILPALSGCYGIPEGTFEEVMVGQLQLKAVGTGIVKADEQKTTYMIRCSTCSFQTDAKTIKTPKPGSPYILDWLCPNCGHAQLIVIDAVEKKKLSEPVAPVAK